MIKHANKILYLGAGTHIESVTHFPETKLFIFIDTQPRSKFDTIHPKFFKGFYEEKFINHLMESCNHFGFKLESNNIIDNNYYKNIISKKWYFSSWIYKIPLYINPTLLVFYNSETKQKIKYYISTNIKFNICKILYEDIKTCDGFIVRNHFPDIEILKYFELPKVFFGYNNISYFIDPNSNDINIITFLHNYLCNTQYYFTEFYLINNDNGIIYKCQDFKNLYELSQEHICLNSNLSEDKKINLKLF